MGYQVETPHLTSSSKKKGWTFALLAFVLLLCLCTSGLMLAGFLFRDQVPFLSDLIASPTPTLTPTSTFTPTMQCVSYDEPSLGIHYCAPPGWFTTHEPESSALLLSPIRDILLESDFPPGGVAVVLFRDLDTVSLFGGEIPDISSPEVLHDYLLTSMGDGTMVELEPYVSHEIAGYPGGSSLFLFQEEFPYDVVVGVHVAMSGEIPTFILNLVDASVWEAYRPFIEAILDSLVIDLVMP